VYTYSRGGFLAVILSLLYMAIRRPPRPAPLSSCRPTSTWSFWISACPAWTA
jgi:hypothetical protein